jgi:putative nucleotidyltransferase with HDIG domain
VTPASLFLVFERSRPEWAAHSRRVAELSERVGLRLGLTDGPLATLRLGALLHDLGKLKVPMKVLEKPSALTPVERAIVQRHAAIGAELLRTASVAQSVCRLVQRHHERLDGSGYPLGLGGDDLDLEVRILAVCDVYDALASDRPYASAWPHEKVLDYLRHDAGRVFDRQCVGALQEVLEVLSRLSSAA